MPKVASTLVTRRPGFRFVQGQLCITMEQAEIRLRTWPLLEVAAEVPVKHNQDLLRRSRYSGTRLH